MQREQQLHKVNSSREHKARFMVIVFHKNCLPGNCLSFYLRTWTIRSCVSARMLPEREKDEWIKERLLRSHLWRGNCSEWPRHYLVLLAQSFQKWRCLKHKQRLVKNKFVVYPHSCPLKEILVIRGRYLHMHVYQLFCLGIRSEKINLFLH